MNTGIQRYMSVVLCAAALVVGLTGCVSGGGTKKGSQKAPDWFLTQPKDDATYKYFVGSGTSKTGDLAEAEKTAVGDIIGKIFMYIGVEITSETTAEARASKDQFESDVLSVVKTSGATKLSGFELVEKLPHEREGEVSLYILARYNKKELEARKAEIERIFKEREEAISGPEMEGIAFMKQGKFYQAAVKFIDAAVASSTSKVANAEIKFKRNIDQAKEAVEKITLIKLNDNLESLAGVEFPEPFRLKVANGTSEEDPGVPGVAVEVSYRAVTRTGLTWKSASLKTNNDGVIEFVHPIPEFVGSESVKMILNLDAYIEALSDVPVKYSELVDGLAGLIVTKKTAFAYRLTSNAKNIETGIVILDIDADGNGIAKTETAQALLSALSEEKFRIKNLPMKPGELLDKGDFEIIEVLAAKYSSSVKRAIFGTARILSFNERDGKTIAKCSGTVQVVDLVSKEVILTLVKDINEMGKDEQQAASGAFKKLGKEIGKEIKNKLR